MTHSTSVWTIWRGRDDGPDLPAIASEYRYMARRYEALAGNVYTTTDFILADELDSIRLRLQRKGLALIPRSDGDDPRIIESWI